jgi:TPR repeat protein
VSIKHLGTYVVVALCLAACTSAPIYAFMGYDSLKKRGRLEDRASKGDVYAQLELAESYCCEMVEGMIDYELSMHWYCVAAKNGDAKAHLALGEIYEGQKEMGELAIEQDDALAYVWYRAGTERFYYKAEERLKALKKRISEKDLARGRTLFKKWRTLECGKKEHVE